jgi:hypothetical protein
MTIVHTRPERTEDDIRADEEAAGEFWKRLPTHNPYLRRLIEHESYDHKLLLADREGRAWAGRQHDNASDRRARRAARRAADPLSERRDENLRRYVDPAFRLRMPSPRLGNKTKAERVASLSKSTAWFHELSKISDRRLAKALRDENHQFVHWLLENPQYGPIHEGPALTPRSFEPWHYVPGQVRPAGLTPERALEIAIAVLEARGGTW